MFIGIGSLGEPFTTDQTFGALDAQERGSLVDKAASSLSVPSEHRDLDGLRSGGLNTVAVATRSLTHRFNGEVWSEAVVSN